MDIHKNGRLTPLGRERSVKMVLGGQTPKTSDDAAGACPRTAHKWVQRFFMRRYSWRRPHASIGGMFPISRRGLAKDHLLRLHR